MSLFLFPPQHLSLVLFVQVHSSHFGLCSSQLTLLCSDEASHFDYASGLVRLVDGMGGSLAGSVAPEEKLAKLKRATTCTALCLPLLFAMMAFFVFGFCFSCQTPPQKKLTFLFKHVLHRVTGIAD